MAPLVTLQSQMSSLAENQPIETSLGSTQESVRHIVVSGHNAFAFGITGCLQLSENLNLTFDVLDRAWVDVILQAPGSTKCWLVGMRARLTHAYLSLAFGWWAAATAQLEL